MSFDIHNDVWVGWALGSVVPATPNDNSAPAYAALPGSFSIVGYSKVPQGNAGLSNSQGRSAGLAEGAYNRRGGVTPGVSFQFCPGSQGLIANCLRAEGGSLPYLEIYEGVYDQWCRVYRGSKCSQIEFDLGANNGQGGEVMISASFESIARYDLSVLPTVSRSLLQNLGTPLFWHDVRQLSIVHADGNPYGYRGGVTDAKLRCSHTLVRGVQRPFYGDDNPLSLTSEEIRETDIMASGDLTFNRKVGPIALSAAKNSRDWGNLSVGLTDGPGIPGDATARGFSLTATRAFPSNDTSGDSGGIISHQMPFTAKNLVYTPLA